MADRIRTTISVDPEVHAIFVRMAEAAGTSVSRCMGDWLADTAEGAQLIAQKMAEARQAPKVVLRELQGWTQGLMDELQETQDKMRREGLRGAGGAGRAQAIAPQPPSSPTGVKSPSEGHRKGRKAA